MEAKRFVLLVMIIISAHAKAKSDEPELRATAWVDGNQCVLTYSTGLGLEINGEEKVAFKGPIDQIQDIHVDLDKNALHFTTSAWVTKDISVTFDLKEDARTFGIKLLKDRNFALKPFQLTKRSLREKQQWIDDGDREYDRLGQGGPEVETFLKGRASEAKEAREKHLKSHLESLSNMKELNKIQKAKLRRVAGALKAVGSGAVKAVSSWAPKQNNKVAALSPGYQP